MSVECSCASNPKNTGRLACVGLPTRVISEVFANYVDSDGNVNGIPDGTTIDETFISAKLNHTDPTKRWYVLPKITTYLSEREDDLTEEIDGFAKTTGEYGVRTVSYEMEGINSSVQLEKALKSYKCGSWGVLKLTRTGQIVGTNTGDGDLLFTKIENDTLKVMPVDESRGVLPRIKVSYQVDETELDSQRDFIASEDIEYGTKNWYSISPVQVYISEVTSTALDTIVVQLSWMFKDAGNKNPIEGFVADDFNTNGVSTVYNVTDSASVGITTATESTTIPGRYTIVLASAQTDQDVIRIDISKTGYDADYLDVFIGSTS